MLKTGSRFTIDIAFIEVSFFQVKQRIIDVDTKNSLGLVGHIEELSHNALAVYWNPLESPAKVNLAVQCLSTDFRWDRWVESDVNSDIPFQYTKRSKRSSTAHTNWHVRRSQIWCWSAAVSQRLFSSQNILRQRSWEEAARRGEASSEASYDSQWEAKAGRDVSWIFWKVRSNTFIGQSRDDGEMITQCFWLLKIFVCYNPEKIVPIDRDWQNWTPFIIQLRSNALCKILCVFMVVPQ